MKAKTLLRLALALSGGLAVVRADMVPGVDWYVANAEVIKVVQVEMPPAAETFPSPPDKQRVWVKDVLKGLDSAQEFLLPKGTLQPGQTAVVLYEYEPPSNYEPALQILTGTQPVMSVWPIDAVGKVDTRGVPAQMESSFITHPDAGGISLELIKKAIVASSPEEVGLYGQVVDALLFPARLQELARSDARRSTYVRFVVAIRDLDRDVTWLARLLESKEQTIRAAAVERLEALTGTRNPAPEDKSPQSLHAWAQTWAKQATPTQVSRWPPVPADLKTPPDAFPEALIQALQKEDADVFAKAFAGWLDSGVMRDREIHYAETLDRKVVNGSNLGGANGYSAYLPGAPRLRPDVVLGTNLPAIDRMKAIALLANIWHYDRFAREQTEARTLVVAAPHESDILRRAAFWELREAGVQTAGWVALSRLAQTGEDESTQRFTLGLCLDKLDDDALEAARVEIKAGRQIFMDGLFAYLGTHGDRTAQWIGRLLCQEGQKQAIPVMLTWLKDKDSQVRNAGAFNLCWLPSAAAVSDLLIAIQSESDREVKGQMLVALAQTGDPRGLEALLAAAREPYDSEVAAQIMRGLGRIRDPKALTALADIASGLSWMTIGDGQSSNSKAPAGSWDLLSDAVNAFGYISQAYEAHAPDRFWGNSAIDPVQLRLELARIEEWRKLQGNKP
jgi:hypothetical protein